MKDLTRRVFNIFHNRIPFGEKDGIGAFSALAGFALAQSVALTAVAKDEKFETLVLWIYVVAVAATTAWIWWLVTSIKAQDGNQVRWFDQATITYGRCTLVWQFLVAVAMVVLGMNHLLPNQTPRKYFTDYRIPCTVTPIQNVDVTKAGSTNADKLLAKGWLGWLQAGAVAKLNEDESKRRAIQAGQVPSSGATNQRLKTTTQLVGMVQETAFKPSYHTFAATLKVDPGYLISEHVGFLVRNVAGEMPTYRQLAFRYDPNSTRFTNTFDLIDPNEGEFLVIFAYIEHQDGSPVEPETSTSTRPAYGLVVEQGR